MEKNKRDGRSKVRKKCNVPKGQNQGRKTEKRRKSTVVIKRE